MPRWLRFNAVGAAGALVQLAVLTLLIGGPHVHYLVATAASVETAVLHNFFWHERWTWKDRLDGSSRRLRLLRFHASNGVVSILSNLLLMRWLAGAMHLPIAPANVICILMTSLLNFALGELFVYPRTAGAAPSSPRG